MTRRMTHPPHIPMTHHPHIPIQLQLDAASAASSLPHLNALTALTHLNLCLGYLGGSSGGSSSMAWLGQLTGLVWLDLSDSGLACLPDELGECRVGQPVDEPWYESWCQRGVIQSPGLCSVSHSKWIGPCGGPCGLAAAYFLIVCLEFWVTWQRSRSG